MGIEQVGVMEFFREHVDSALCNQKVPAAELTVFYLVQLLKKFVNPHEDPRYRNDPLVIALKRAAVVAISNYERRRLFREIGDRALFITGFFEGRLNRSFVNPEYYIGFGEEAYQYLSNDKEDMLSEIFTDLSKRFAVYSDVLSEVRDRTNCWTNKELIRLYEKWLKTKSPGMVDILVERGFPLQTLKARPRLQ